MSIINFDYLTPTTMTVIIKLNGNIDIEKLFPLLKITKIRINNSNLTKKYKIPFCGKPGAILSANYKGIYKGIIKSLSKNYFRNSITFDLCTSIKNINAKLSSNTIHMCGLNSEELSKEATGLIIKNITNIQNMLNYIKKNKSKSIKTIEWIKKNTIGKNYCINSETHEIINLKFNDYINSNGYLVNQNGFIYMSFKKNKDIIKCNKIKPIFVKSLIINNNIKQILNNKDNTFNKDIDINLCKFCLNYISNYAYYNDYCLFLDNLININYIIKSPLSIKNISIAMINYSYTLNMNINRAKFALFINNVNNLISTYDNTSDCYVKVELPYDINYSSIIKKKYKVSKHTFMIYKSGLVTQSGPSVLLCKKAYYIFREAVEKIRNKVEKKGKPFCIKYIPIEH